MRVSSPIYEEVEFERRVEFHMSRNTERDVSYRSCSPPGPWIRNQIFRERKDGKDKKDVKTEKKESKETKKDKREKKDIGDERDVRRNSAKEVRKNQSPPTSLLPGYKYPSQLPKSILTQRIEATQPQSPSISQQLQPPSNPPDFKSPTEISFVKQARQPMDRQKGLPITTLLISSHLSRRTLESNLERTKHPSKTHHNNPR